MIQYPVAEVLNGVSVGWRIGRDRGSWTALRRSADGRHERYLVARTPAELAAKIVKAKAEGE